MLIEDRFVDLGPLRFHYHEAGDPAGHAVVLLHALGCGCDDWDDVLRDLADSHRMLAFELRGSYRSARQPRTSGPDRSGRRAHPGLPPDHRGR